MKIALAQINTTVGDIEGNVDKILRFAAEGKDRQAELIIFPELTITGYPPGDLLLKDSFIKANLLALDKIKNSLAQLGLAAIVGFVDHNPSRGRRLYNACALLKDGEVKVKQYKTLLPTYDVFDEDRYFQSADSYNLVELSKHKIGLTICEDAWAADAMQGSYFHGVDAINGRYFVDHVAQVAKLKPDFIVNIAASPFAIGKHLVRENLLRQHALRWKVPLIFVNQIGGDDELIFDGRSFVIDSEGKTIACASAFEEDLLIIDFNKTDYKISGSFKQAEEAKLEIYKALVLGTRDYVNKCGFSDVVLGLSGGIDSAVTASVACQALGAQHVLGLCMPSPYSSPSSITDSELLAKNLGMNIITIPINKTMQEFDLILSEPFAGTAPDVTEENLQARLRGVLLMAFSNKFRRMLLTTGNKSELAVGYCTLYGDMCGGLAVISDLPKMRVYELANTINEEAGYDLIPQSIIAKAPSAELSPGQKDEDSLPPYPVLDAILQAYIEEGKTVEEIIKVGYAPETVTKIVQMIERNEFKRRQAAPGLKLTRRAFGAGWKMPIAQRYREIV